MEDVDPRDAEKVYGALYYFNGDGAVSPSDLNPPFDWGEYLVDCLDFLVDEYDGVHEKSGEYWISELEEEKSY